MVRMLVMLSRGFFSSTSRSAALPLASVPNSLSMPRASEAPFEKDWITYIGVWPDCTIMMEQQSGDWEEWLL